MSTLPYRPHPLLRNGHLQTLMVGVVSGERPPYNATPLRIPLPDGESLVAHVENGPPISRQADLVILIHGLGGDHRSAYLERLAPRLRRSGFQVWRIDLRGCGAGLKEAWKPANAGRSDDLAVAVNQAIQLYPEIPIHIVGFSLSGNIVLKMLAEASIFPGYLIDPARIRSALAIAPPADLRTCADNMDRFSRRLYSHYYLGNLANEVQKRRSQWEQWARIPEGPKLKTIRQFDARYTAPLSGFASADEYYRKSSSVDLLDQIQVETEIVVDRHDPIVVSKSFESVALAPQTTLTKTRFGGHMGYFGLDEEGKSVRWLEYYVCRQLAHRRG